MTDTTSQQDVRWDPPGPGPWEAEGAHFPKPVPVFAREATIQAFKAGFSEGTARYGLLLSHFEIAIVNGFWYQQPAAFGAPKGAKGPPPAPVLWLLTRLHPAMRGRIRTSRDAFEGRIWHEDLRRWDEEDKPAALARHKELLGVDPSKLDDAALLAHLADCERHVGAMVGLHHRYTIPCCVPVGDLLAHASEWTGKSPGEILRTLRGSTPVSLGFSHAELDDLAHAIRSEGTASLLEGPGDALARLDALRAAPGKTGEAAAKFLDLVWHRAVSYDLGEKATGEMPEVLLGSVRAAVAGANKPRGEDAAANAKALRELVPFEHRARFDELLGEARAINRLRDERGLYADCWAIGIARRAILEVGGRLTERGKLHAADHAVDLDLAEAKALMTDRGGPSADTIRDRVTWRRTKSVADVPPFLGGQPAGPPDASILPAPARRAARAVDAVLSNLFKETEKSSTDAIVRGISVNDGVYEGTARLVSDASEFGRLQQGDVLVTRATAPYFNVVLPMLGAIVTDRGGQLCHAAIVAREYGIPGVVGTKEATKRIPDGARVRVDGGAGEIRILSRP
jgi:rifampicin phosphotransferase